MSSPLGSTHTHLLVGLDIQSPTEDIIVFPPESLTRARSLDILGVTCRDGQIDFIFTWGVLATRGAGPTEVRGLIWPCRLCGLASGIRAA